MTVQAQVSGFGALLLFQSEIEVNRNRNTETEKPVSRIYRARGSGVGDNIECLVIQTCALRIRLFSTESLHAATEATTRKKCSITLLTLWENVKVDFRAEKAD